MRNAIRLAVVPLAVTALVMLGVPAAAEHDSDPRTKNLHPLGHIEEPAVLGGFGGAQPDIHTDIAFWGQHAFQGNWDGFNIRDISDPENPTTVSRTFCDGNQGDIIVWEDILVRAWNTPAGTPGAFGAGLTCDGQAVPAGFEGLHVFDISDPGDPELVGSVNLSAAALPADPSTGRPARCGSHTLTAVPDPQNDRLLVYNSGSGCAGIDVVEVEVPLDDPATPSFLRWESSGDPTASPPIAARNCHDTSVIFGDAMLAACAGGNGFTVWSIGGANGGSLADPQFLGSVPITGVTIGHSAAFTWDGQVLVFGHEPGGGVAAECEATDVAVKKSFFFFETDPAGGFSQIGQWTLTRAQGPTENCTLHNFNVVPLRSDRYVLVQGSYQSGTAVLDFTDPANAVELAWSDPPPAAVPPGSPFCAPVGCDVTGAWSSYWYNNFIHETSIGEGLNVFRFSGSQTAGAIRLDHLNPQTQEFTL